jgi:hypothetical protein
MAVKKTHADKVKLRSNRDTAMQIAVTNAYEYAKACTGIERTHAFEIYDNLIASGRHVNNEQCRSVSKGDSDENY